MKKTDNVKFQLSIGMNDNDTKRQKHTKKYFVSRITSLFPNVSISEMVGAYNGEIEKSLHVTYFGKYAEKTSVIEKIENLKKTLNQECIVLEIVKCNSLFI